MTKKEYIERYGEEAWERRKECHKAWYAEHREERKEYLKTYYLKHKEQISERHKEQWKNYYSTLLGRAKRLANDYRRRDRDANRGESTLTTNWIVENILKEKCIYCGDSDWRHLGVDRIDNTKPHTPDNVVCACGVCNAERSDRYSVEEFKEYRKTHLRSCDFLKSIKPEIVSVDGIKVIRKRK